MIEVDNIMGFASQRVKHQMLEKVLKKSQDRELLER